MKLTYRKANPSDLDEICALVRRAVRHMLEQQIYQWDELYPLREDFQEDIEQGQLYVGLLDGGIAVLYTLNQECDEEYRDGAWKHPEEPFYVLHRLCVDPNIQNQGIAKQTLAHIEEEIKPLGVHSMRLDVFSGNSAAFARYCHSGYRKVGEVHWRKGMFHLMEKQI